MTTANNSSTELPPMYDPTQVEPAILKQYLDTKAYAASPDSKGEPYSIVIPPPNVTAALHLGHALNNTLQDVLTRVHRMRGFNTLWMPGTDHAGIATQSIVDKRLQQEGQPALKEYKQQELNEGTGRDAFIGKVTAWKDEYEETITNQLKEMGCSCDWDRQRFTMDDQCAKAVREAFFQLFKDGLIYRGKRLVNWDPISQTALADDEVEMQDIDGNFYYMKYPVCDKDGNLTGDFATVATTRPETMLGDTAIAVNPDDEPRAKYIGQFVKLPIVNRVIPVVGDDYVVIPDSESDDSKARMASGFLKVTPAHDPNDYEIGTRHDLAIINVMAPDASISIDHGWPAEENPSDNADLKPFVGLAREEARKQIVIWFKDHDLMGEVKPYRHAVGHSYRSHVPIEPYYTDQWYVKVTDDKLKGEALRAMSALQRQPSDDPSFQKGGVGVAPAIESPHRLSLHQSHLPDFQAEAPTYFATIRVLKNRLSNKDRKLVVDACLFNHGKTMQVHLVTAMPDHTHLLFTPMPKEDGSYPTARELLKAIKSYTAPIISKRHKFVGSVWNSENVETLVQDNDTFAEKWQYMQMNPVKANMVEKPEDYAYSAMPADAAAFEKGGVGVSPAVGPQDQIGLATAKRRLPHWELEGSTYFITFRLAQGELDQAERQMVLDACLHWHGDRADIFLCTVMPDHVHLLFQPLKKDETQWHALSDLLHSIKSFTAHAINKGRNTTGQVWQDESYDRIVRDEAEFEEKWQYIETNPARAELIKPGEVYPFTASGDSSLRADGRRDAHPTAQGNENQGDAGLTFTPDRYAKTFQNWHENIRDWCISRQLWWGHRIPVWRFACGESLTFTATETNPRMPIDALKDMQLRIEAYLNACGFENQFTFYPLNENDYCVRVCTKSLAVDNAIEAYRTWHRGFELKEVKPGEDVEYQKPLPDEYNEAFNQACDLNDSVLAYSESDIVLDPDVLDTWFSSALWPMSTMGWPEQTPELAKWNPTSVLCTAREIITLWVSRMVMFNRYFKGGDLPFNDVFIHAMIQDGHGQKMSKSLGNGVDPMDIIHSHGADAMRYTLTKMTTQTQDVRLSVDMVDPHSGETFTPEYVTASGGVKVAAPVQERNGKKMVSSYGIASGKEKATDDIPAARNTSEKFDEGQKFANKLWNAFRFAFASLGELGEANADFALAQDNATLADRWILDRLGKTIESADKALAEYRFSDYATTLYDFVWRDLCDWYIEIVKRSLSNTPSQQRVLVTCLDASLRLLHPVMPFITERLWEALNDRVPSAWRGVPGLALEPGELLIHAAWPEADGALMDASAEASFEKLRSIVDAVRNARNAYKIPPKQAVEATTTAPGPVSQLIYEARYVTGPLTNCIGRGVGPSIERPAGSAAVLIGDVTVYLHDVIDVETEKARLEKLLVDQTKQVKTFEGRLANKKYVDNAPANLVQETRDQHAAAVKVLDQIKQQLGDLAG